MPIINPPVPSDGNNAVAADVDNPVNQIVALLNGGLDTDNFADGGIQLADLAAAVQALLVPVATVVPFAGQTEPTGWIFCYGQSLLRSSYPSLFAAIGTNYGSADGTHFSVPDLRGRIPVGRDNMGGVAGNVLQHSTTITTTNASNSATVGSASGLSNGMFINSTNVPGGTYITNISGTTITMSGNATASASGTAARFSLVLDAQNLGASGGGDAIILITAQLASHTHSVEGGQNQFVHGGTGGNPASITQGGTAFRVTAPGTGTDATGNDQSHPNLQPSVVTNYLIKT